MTRLLQADNEGNLNHSNNNNSDLWDVVERDSHHDKWAATMQYNHSICLRISEIYTIKNEDKNSTSNVSLKGATLYFKHTIMQLSARLLTL